MSQLRWAALVASAALTLGCPSDINWPELLSVDFVDGSNVVGSIDVGDLSETVFETDVPVTSHFVLLFDEPVTMNTAEGNIWITDAHDARVEVTLNARLEEVTATPVTTLTAGENHVLHVDDAIEDTAGHGLWQYYNISFYTAP